MRLFLFLSLVLFAFQSPAQGIHGEKTQVIVSIADQELAKFSEDERKLIDAMREAFTQNLWTWSAMNTDMPETVFTSGSVAVRFADLFSSPTSQELRELALGADGKPRKLSDEEIAQIKEEGLLIIPSQKYPGQNHVWKLAFWLQSGRKNIEITAQKGVADGLRKFVVLIPDRFRMSSTFNAGHGLVNIWKGLRNSVSHVVGLKEMKGRYSDSQITKILEEEAFQYIRATRTISDYRLYDEELMAKAVPILERIAEKVEAEWSNGLRTTYIQNEVTALSAQGLSQKEIEQKVAANLNLLRESLFRGNVLQSAELKALSPDLGELLVRRHLATQMMLRAEAEITADVEAHGESVRTDLLARYPVRARVQEWIEKRVDAAKAEHLAAIQMNRYDKLVEEMRDLGLKDETTILEHNLKFYREQAPIWRSELARKKVAARRFNLNYRIFVARNWIAKEEERNGEKVFVAQKYTTASTSTDRYLWRLRLARQRTWQMLKEVNYVLAVENLMNGPLGIQALVRKESFTPFKMMDPKTGEIVVDQTRKVSTLRERHQQIWSFVERKLNDFEAAPENSFISKDAVRGMHKTFRYTQGAVSTATLWGFQPAATLANVAMSGAVMATSLAWAPLTSAFILGADALMFDSHAPDHSSPLLPVIGDLLVRGAGGVIEFAGSVVAPAPLAVMGLTEMAYAKVKQGAHNIWDKFMAWKLIKRFAKVPDSDSYFVRRVAGPDLAAQYTYQIHPELAVLGLQAKLESVELDLSYQERVAALQKPILEARHFMKRFFGKFFADGSAFSHDITKQVEEPPTRLREELDQKYRERLKVVPDTAFDSRGKAVRQTQEDLEKTLAASVGVVTKFYQERLLPYIAGQEASFWNRYAIAQGDFVGLTRHFLQETFGEQFIKPLEGVDENFKVDVAVQPDLGVLESILDGTGVNLDDEHLSVPPTQQVTAINPQVAPFRELVGGMSRSACSVFWSTK